MAEVTHPRPLAEIDDRAGFDCGRESLNNWFRRHAWANHVEGISRVNVICAVDSGAVAGFVTLSAAQIERSFLPKPLQRNRPDPLPATLLGQLAVRKDFQGPGPARSLMIFALTAAARAAESVGSFAVIIHPLDENLRMLYAKWGFVDLPNDPGRAMILRMVDLKKSDINDH